MIYIYIGFYKSNEVQQLRALPRQRLFLGEGPWAHVPVEHEMSGDGVGKNFDGANGVIVDSDPWTKEANIFLFILANSMHYRYSAFGYL
jgi:hypothetical protein